MNKQIQTHIEAIQSIIKKLDDDILNLIKDRTEVEDTLKALLPKAGKGKSTAAKKSTATGELKPKALEALTHITKGATTYEKLAKAMGIQEQGATLHAKALRDAGKIEITGKGKEAAFKVK